MARLCSQYVGRYEFVPSCTVAHKSDHSTVTAVWFHAKICEQTQDKGGVFSSTPLVQRKCLFPEQHNATDLGSTVLQESGANETVR